MESIPTRFEDGTIKIDGIPDAVSIVELDDAKAQRLADLALHRKDLAFAEECLVEIASVEGKPEHSEVVKNGLWLAAISSFFKCFGDGSRFKLNSKSVFKGEPEEAFVVFDYFKNLRNKHLIHDENSYHQCQPAAILNDGKKAYKIEKIVCFSVTRQTLQQESFANMHLLVTHAKVWVIKEFDQLADSIRNELESKSYSDLATLASPVTTPATVEDVARRRAR
jgi:hypothetical protein